MQLLPLMTTEQQQQQESSASWLHVADNPHKTDSLTRYAHQLVWSGVV